MAVPAALLATLGVALSIVLVAWPLHWITGMDLRTAVLIAAVLAPTDAAAVFTVARGLRLPSRLQTLIEAESGLNDAPVVVLVVLLSTTVGSEMPAWLIPIVVVAELVGGLVVGVLVGLFARWLLPRLALPASGLYPVAVIALLMLAYGLAVVLHTSGFAAVYVVALIMAASPAAAPPLGARLHRGAGVDGPDRAVRHARPAGRSPAALGESVGIALLAGALLLVVARPLSVLASLGAFLRPGWVTRGPGRSRCPGSGSRSSRGPACAGRCPSSSRPSRWARTCPTVS